MRLPLLSLAVGAEKRHGFDDSVDLVSWKENDNAWIHALDGKWRDWCYDNVFEEFVLSGRERQGLELP